MEWFQEWLKCPSDLKNERNPPSIKYNGLEFHPPSLESKLSHCSFLGADLFREVGGLSGMLDT